MVQKKVFQHLYTTTSCYNSQMSVPTDENKVTQQHLITNSVVTEKGTASVCRKEPALHWQANVSTHSSYDICFCLPPAVCAAPQVLSPSASARKKNLMPVCILEL
uniref:Uncharacterized protein n=1 Tax=Eutreptiella gymnastica TaxID=73025 RepID=A0A7S1HX00_9EUGL|mmetsp:Transcript_110675/g.191844  ORF Transcript_110675/g.191844 Transcript_110675/m.191844 type:complete len:105 (+) Transcript_110675:398-712(+)